MKNLITTILILVLPIALYCAIQKRPIAESSLAQSTKPQVLKFTSPMCSSCQKLRKEFEALIPAYSDRIDFVEVNVTKGGRATDKLIDEYNITGVPVTIFIDTKQGKEKRIVGEANRETLEQHIKELLHE